MDGGAAGRRARTASKPAAAGFRNVAGGFDQGGIAAHDAAAHGAEGCVPEF
jgi:hypothetical protein